MTDKRNLVLNIVIIILTVVLFCMAGVLMKKTAPRTDLYRPYEAKNMINNIERGRYNNLVDAKYTNEMLGVHTNGSDSFAVPYAASDYYEAALCRKGYVGAGETKGTAEFENTMDRARKVMGKYEYIADEIDDFFEN